MLRLFLGLAMACTAIAAAAQSTPIGVWKTIDDVSRQEKSMVRISEKDGVLSGKIDRLLDPEVKQGAICDLCRDDRKGKPLVGLNILRDVKKNAKDDALWDGGSILDPANGKNYKVRLKLAEGGRKLEVRGYVGVPMWGRTQTWIRAE